MSMTAADARRIWHNIDDRVIHTDGRLVVAQFSGNPSASTMLRMTSSLASTVGSLPKQGILVCDARLMPTLSPEVAEGYIAVMKADNKKLDKSAILASSGTSSLQIWRAAKESQNEHRKPFKQPDEVLQWLESDLTHDEMFALRMYFHNVERLLRDRKGP